MLLDRRKLLEQAAGTVAASAMPVRLQAQAAIKPHCKAVAFDAFPIFDPRPITGLTETLFPGKGGEFSNLWRTKQCEYQWLHALGRRYRDFWQTTEDALEFAARSLNLDLTSEKRDALMNAYLNLKAWADVLPALRSLKQSGLRLALLSNMTEKMLTMNIKSAGLEGLFEFILATDQIQTYKPDPRAYRMAPEAFRLQKEEIAFAAFSGWDVAGAKWFGYPTFWVNRLNAPAEELGGAADAAGRDLTDLIHFVIARR